VTDVRIAAGNISLNNAAAWREQRDGRDRIPISSVVAIDARAAIMAFPVDA